MTLAPVSRHGARRPAPAPFTGAAGQRPVLGALPGAVRGGALGATDAETAVADRVRSTPWRWAARLVVPWLAALAASAGVFLLAAVSPNNPLSATVAGWEFASPQARAEMEAAYTNDGWAGAWLSWLGSVLTHGDPGYSRTLHTPVAEILAERGINTVGATLTAALIAAVIVLVAVVAFSLLPRLATRGGVTALIGAGLTLPAFLVAIGIVQAFGPHLPNPARTAPVAQIPALAVAIAVAWAVPMIANVRAAAAEQAARPWGRALAGRGAGAGLRLRAMAPGMLRAADAYAFVLLPQVLLGEAAVEAVFGYPGLGNALVGAAAGSDLPLLATMTALAAFLAAVAWTWWPRRAS